MEKIDLENRQIQLTLLLKLQKLQRESLPGLQLKNLEDTLRLWKWRKKTPRTLHEAVNDIMSLSADEIVRVLSQQAIVEGYRTSLNDYEDLLGGVSHD